MHFFEFFSRFSMIRGVKNSFSRVNACYSRRLFIVFGTLILPPLSPLRQRRRGDDLRFRFEFFHVYLRQLRARNPSFREFRVVQEWIFKLFVRPVVGGEIFVHLRFAVSHKDDCFLVRFVVLGGGGGHRRPWWFSFSRRVVVQFFGKCVFFAVD